MDKNEVLANIRHSTVELRAQCVRLQRQESQIEGAGVAELKRMAEAEDPDVFFLGRLLFKARDGGLLRWEWSTLWGLLGGASPSHCPCAPYYVLRGVLFNITNIVRHMGLVEPASHYLSYCMEAGVWNDEPYRDLGRDELLTVAMELVSNGPWARPLTPNEREWLLAQVPEQDKRVGS